MKKLDLSEQQYVDLLVIKEAYSYRTPAGKKKNLWECLCVCGRTTFVETSNLRNGHTTSCGCRAGMIDHVGDRFGRLVAIKHLSGGRYLCICDCGTEIIVRTDNLVNGNTKSCGCLQRDRTSESSFIDLTGQRFGSLVVISLMPYKNRYNHFEYKCKCDCGSIVIVDAANLRTGNTTSCGCIKSRGECLVNKWLQNHGINFRPQYSHDQIVYSSGRRPFFDFALFDSDDNLLCLIEYNGAQHYESGYGWNDEEHHAITVKRDEEKRKRCDEFGIRLYEIPYWDIENIDQVLTNIINEVMQYA